MNKTIYSAVIVWLSFLMLDANAMERQHGQLEGARVILILGERYYREGDYANALTCYSHVANEGSKDFAAMAKNNLGIMYQHGHGVPKDYQKAAEFYREGAYQANDLRLAVAVRKNLAKLEALMNKNG
jgi:TPR repeat protein